MREIILRVKFQRPASRRSLAARVEHCHWSEYVGMSLQERQVTMQVMLVKCITWYLTLQVTHDYVLYIDKLYAHCAYNG